MDIVIGLVVGLFLGAFAVFGMLVSRAGSLGGAFDGTGDRESGED